MTERIRRPRTYSLQILADNDNHLLEGGTGFTIRYPEQETFSLYDMTGRTYTQAARRNDGNLYVAFNEHHSDVLRASRILEQIMYNYRGDLTPFSYTLLIHCEGEPTRTFRECRMVSVQYGMSVEIMEIESNWSFKECDFRDGIPVEEIPTEWWRANDQVIRDHWGDRSQPERVNWQIEGF